jgi:hypothetical protein
LKKGLDDLSRDNSALIDIIGNAKKAIDEDIQSFRQQMCQDGKMLAAVMESIERISKTTTETRSIDTILKRLRFDEIHLRELNITDANQHTYRWLLYSPNDQGQEPTLGGLGAGKFSNTSDITDHTMVIGTSLKQLTKSSWKHQYDSILCA